MALEVLHFGLGWYCAENSKKELGVSRTRSQVHSTRRQDGRGKVQGASRGAPSNRKAINDFKGEQAQLRALEALLAAFNDSPPPSTHARSKGQRPEKKEEPTTKKPASVRGKTRGRSAPKLETVADLNLRPKGKKSLSEFLKDKRPKNQPEQIATIVYYLHNILKVQPISANHVYTCFKTLPELRIPGNTAQSLRNTSDRNGWVVSSNMDDIKITAAGENYVEHDLPTAKPAKDE